MTAHFERETPRQSRVLPCRERLQRRQRHRLLARAAQALTTEWMLAAQELVRDEAERVNVVARTERARRLRIDAVRLGVGTHRDGVERIRIVVVLDRLRQ